MGFIKIKVVSVTALILFLAVELLILTPTLSAPLLQQQALTKADLLALLKSAAKHQILQGDIAAEINERGISFEVNDAVLEELRNAGAKSVVIDALLRAITHRSAAGQPPSNASAEPPPERPSATDNNAPNYNDSRAADEAQALASLPFIEQARHYALSYTQELPNFIVHQHVSRFTRDPMSGQWRPRDTLDLEVSYETSRGESYKLQAINGQPTHKSYEEVGGASSAGEFGTILVALFSQKSQTQFKLGPTDKIDGRPAVIFDFHVPTATSSNQITETRTGQTITSGYRGSVWIDKETKRVLRIEQSADDIPPSFPITLAESAVDYSWAEISGKRFLLPKRAEVIIGSDRERLYSRNVIDFTDYRKFEVDVRITGTEEGDNK